MILPLDFYWVLVLTIGMGAIYAALGLVVLTWLDDQPGYAQFTIGITGLCAWIALLAWPLTCVWLFWCVRRG